MSEEPVINGARLLVWKSPVPEGYPKAKPTTPLIWPVDQHKSNQIQQTKGSAPAQVENAFPSVQPSTPTVVSRTTPPLVLGVRVIHRIAGPGVKQITVQFTHPGGPYFAGANVYLRQAGKPPVLVAGGAKSPISFTVPVSSAPHSIHVSSVSNWGETPVDQSPAAPVNLS